MTSTTDPRSLVERHKEITLKVEAGYDYPLFHADALADALTAALAENERLRVVLSDTADALDLANALLRQKPVQYAIPLTSQFNARHAAADRARDALKGQTNDPV